MKAPPNRLSDPRQRPGTRFTHLFLRCMNTVGRLLGPYPWLYFAAYSLTRAPRSLLVSRDTELLIEGFPSSASSFADVAFNLAQSHPVVLARHVHSPAQIIWAARHGVPAVVLIREPVAAATSLVIRHPYLPLRQALRGYIRFYRALSPYRDRYVLARFEEVTRDFGAVIHRVNRKFGTDFTLFEHTPGNVELCFEALSEYAQSEAESREIQERIAARPSGRREKLAEGLREGAESTKLRALVAEARRVHEDELTAHG